MEAVEGEGVVVEIVGIGDCGCVLVLEDAQPEEVGGARAVAT